jgi:hypothetical protein
MSLTEREAALDLRGRYIRLLDELRRTRDHNPETLDAFEQILQPEALNPYRAAATSALRVATQSVAVVQRRHIAA